jgi:hypothetical protein
MEGSPLNTNPLTPASKIVIIAEPGNAKATGKPEPKAVAIVKTSTARKNSSINNYLNKK